MSTGETAAWDRADLDKMSCQIPNCQTKHHHGPLFLGGRCHPKQPQIVIYRHGGVVELSCKRCKKHTLNVAVSHAERMHMDTHVIECGDPNCKEPPENHFMRLRGCPRHRNAGCFVVYNAGQLTIACGHCKAQIQVLAVRPESERQNPPPTPQA